MGKASLLKVAAVVVLVIFLTGAVGAQVRSGTITGRVVDPSGAAIPEVRVVVVAEETNFNYETKTNGAGDFTVPYLPYGSYSVTATGAGFASRKLTGLSVTTAQTVRADFRLEVQGISQTVEVSAGTAELQTESSSVSRATDRRLIEGLPNVNQNPLYYVSLQAGVVPRALFNDTQSVDSFGVGAKGRANASAFSVNGGQAFTSDIMVDGVSVQGSAWNEVAVLPNPDALQEARTLVNNYSAEYGRAQGVVTLSTKSGNNEWHGTANYQGRNEALNANLFANNARGLSIQDFKAHTFGGTVGGPIVKDRAFFFVSYERMIHNRAVDLWRTVPTALEKTGNFSRTLVNSNGTPTPVQFFDPFNVTKVGTDLYQRAPIPNSIIPTPDKYALKLYSYFPDPNRTPDDVFNTNNYYTRGLRTVRRNGLNTRLDYRHGTKHSIYWTGGLSDGNILSPNAWPEGNPFFMSDGFAGIENGDRNPYAAIGDTIVLSPTTVLDMRYGINRVRTWNMGPEYENFDYSSLGIPASMASINAAAGAPPEYSGLSGTSDKHKREGQINHHIVASMTRIMGPWTMKVGGEFRNYLSNYTDAKESYTIVTAAGYTRQQINAAGEPVGVVAPHLNGYNDASMLLGAGNIQVSPGRGTRLALAQKYWALYVQNDWRATRQLTVNLGLRWEIQPGPTERYNRMSSLDLSASNPFYGQGGIAFPGTANYSRNLWDTQYGNLGPRLGAAYRITENFVIRGGYGLSYLPSNTGFFGGPFNYGTDSFSGFTANAPYGSSPAGVLVGRYYDVNTIYNPVGANVDYPGLYGARNEILIAPKYDLGSRFLRDGWKNGRAQQFNLFLEKSFGKVWLASAGYSGSRGSNLPYSTIPVQHVQSLSNESHSAWRTAWIQNDGKLDLGQQQVPNPAQKPGQPLIAFRDAQGRATVSRMESMFPYFLLGGMQTQQSVGRGSYDSLQIQIDKRMSKGLQFNAHYTWSKSFDASFSDAQGNGYSDTTAIGQVFDYRNFDNMKKLGATDVPHRFVASFVYELPFGQGRSIPVSNAFLKALASGWQVSGAGTYQSGSPLMFVGLNSGAINGRRDRLPDVPVKVPEELQRWYDGKTTVTLPSGRKFTPAAYTYLVYNPDAFRGRVVQTPNGSTVNDNYWWGTSALTYSDIRDVGRANWNFSVDRRMRITERFSLALSARFTNAFNHTQFRPSIQRNLGNTQVTYNAQNNVQPGMSQGQTFGARSTATFDARQIEIALKLRF